MIAPHGTPIIPLTANSMTTPRSGIKPWHGTHHYDRRGQGRRAAAVVAEEEAGTAEGEEGAVAL